MSFKLILSGKSLSLSLFLIFVYVFNILHVKRRHTFPKGNKGRDVTEHDDTRDEKISLLTRDSKGGEEVEEPPKVNLCTFQTYELTELC